MPALPLVVVETESGAEVRLRDADAGEAYPTLRAALDSLLSDDDYRPKRGILRDESGREVGQFSQFRVTRHSDLSVDEEDVENLRTALRQGLVHRHFGQAVRLEARVEALMAENAALRARLERATDVSRRLLDEREASAEPEAPAWTPPPLPAPTGQRLVAPAGA